MFEWLGRFRQERVILPDGRIGVIDHLKPDGKLGVRPINPITGMFLPNRSEHWSEDERARIPEEIALSPHDIRSARTGRRPLLYKVRL